MHVRMASPEPSTSRAAAAYGTLPNYGDVPQKLPRNGGPCASCQPYVARRFLALVVACLAKMVAGSTSVFHMYANAVKKTFQYTQSEVAVIAAMHVMGTNLILPAGMLYDRLGPMWTTLIGLVLSCIGYGLIYSAVSSSDYNNVVFALFFFLANHGTLYMYMAAMVTGITNFPAQHRAKVVALLDTMYGGGMMVFATIYNEFFINGHYKDEENQNLKGFMLFLLITVSCTYFLSVLFLRVFPLDEPLLEDSFLMPMQVPVSRSLLADFDDLTSTDNFVPNTKATQTLLPKMRDVPQDQNTYLRTHFIRTFLSLDFQCLMWSFALICATTVMFMNNMTAVTKSVGMGRNNWLLTMVFSGVGMATRFVASPISDLTYPRLPRVTFLVMGHFCSVASFIALSFAADVKYALFTAAGLIGLSISMNYTFSTTALSEHFGTDHFGLHFGIFKLLDAVAGFSTNRAFGAIYDGQIHNRTASVTDCYGKHCSQGSMILGAVLSTCALICAIGFILKTRTR